MSPLANRVRNSPSSAFMATRQKQMQYMRMVKVPGFRRVTADIYSGCEPLTPDDIAEVVVFNAGRRENVVIADTLIFPSHQVSLSSVFDEYHSTFSMDSVSASSYRRIAM